MGGSQKSKRVSWASDVNLCQVRLFLSEESPAQVGMGTQDHLQAKTWPLHAGGMGSDENLPPGFEGIQPANPWAAKLSQISLVKWKCPPRFEVDSSWRVVAGDESREIETQNQREMRVLEAIYPRPSAIPLNPSALVGAEDSTNNDQSTPVVPITPIEDEDASLDTSYASMASNSTPMIAHQLHSPHLTFSSQVNATLKPTAGFPLTGVEPDIIAAAQAALSSVMSNSDQGNLIDRELLMKILSDPKMIEQLITSHAASSSGQNAASSSAQSMPSSSTFHGMPVIGSESVVTSSTQNMLPSSLQGMPAIGTKNVASCSSPGMPSTSTQYIPNLVSPPKVPFDPVNVALHRREQPHSARVTRPEMVAPSISAASGPFHPPSRTGSIPHLRPSVPDVISAPPPSIAAPVTKDLNYYKSLIQQHGGERRENMPQFSHQSNQPPGMGQEPLNNMMMKPRDSKPKTMKPCIYFNSSRGCRNGSNCAFQHDATSQQKVNSIPEVQGTKRVKLDREITGA